MCISPSEGSRVGDFRLAKDLNA